MESVVVTGARRATPATGTWQRQAFHCPREHPVLPSEGRDKFEHFDSNPVKQVADDPVSTFSVDVDTSSYSFVRASSTQACCRKRTQCAPRR